MTNEERAMSIASDIYLNKIYGVKDVARVIQDELDAAVAAERARCVAIAEGFTRAPMDYREWSPGLAADDRARLIAAALAAAPEKVGIKSKPNPGSDEAIELGCKCPILDNAKGRGAYFGPPGSFIISSACPIHGGGGRESS